MLGYPQHIHFWQIWQLSHSLFDFNLVRNIGSGLKAIREPSARTLNKIGNKRDCVHSVVILILARDYSIALRIISTAQQIPHSHETIVFRLLQQASHPFGAEGCSWSAHVGNAKWIENQSPLKL